MCTGYAGAGADDKHLLSWAKKQRVAVVLQQLLIVANFGTITWTLSSHGHLAPSRSAAMCVRLGEDMLLPPAV